MMKTVAACFIVSSTSKHSLLVAEIRQVKFVDEFFLLFRCWLVTKLVVTNPDPEILPGSREIFFLKFIKWAL